ncbi:MAG TPA: acetate--CoA ligase family protein, partial [Bacteroidales bacterium]|nr:acetate--CoA ligase family protein [Bacteroidales bacterium]
AAKELLTHLWPGSSVANPIDFLATGTAEQLGIIIDYCDKKFDEIDAMIVIFGSPGLFEVSEVYKVLHEKMNICNKPIFPVLPSIINAKKEINTFLSYGRINFPDEVVLGNALAKIINTPKPETLKVVDNINIDKDKIKSLLKDNSSGYLKPNIVQEILDSAGIPRAKEVIVHTIEQAILEANNLGFPIVMKVIGPVHKSDVGGVCLNITNIEQVKKEFDKMIKIPEATGILLQPMLSGIELFVGAKREDNFGHIVMFGMGGVFIEVLKDFTTGIVPLGEEEIRRMIKGIKSYDIIKGVRGKEGIEENKIFDVLQRLSLLLEAAPEISELDINPLLGKGKQLIAVDARIKIN